MEDSIKRFLPAFFLVLIIICLAPFVGLLRDFLFDTFADGAVRGLSIAFAVLGVVLLVSALIRIRQRRWLRYGGLAASGGLVWLQAVGFKTDLAQVNVAEKIHLVEYGLLALLLYMALLPERSADGDPDPAADEAAPTADLGLFILPLLWVVWAGTLDEGMQWWVETRTGEIRDVLLNLLSGACGLLFAFSLQPPRRFAWKLPPWRPVAVSGTLTTLTLGIFFYLAHLGYMIEDPEIGRFRSWHSPQELVATAAARREAWATNPPGDLSPWQSEDLFLTEAGWHNRHRNVSYEHGDDALALQANRILEKYYAPYLDLESFRQTGDRRFPPHAVRRVEQAADAVDTATYVSPVLSQRIYTWPSKPLFLGLLSIALGLWWVPMLGRRRRSSGD